MSDKTTIYLIRHGETQANRDNIFRGRLDVPLNQVGLLEAEAVSEALSQTNLAAIYSSPLSRAIATVTPLSLVKGIDIIHEQDLIDIDFGKWQGQTLSSIAGQQPQLLDEWEKEPQLVRFPDGETIGEVRFRAFNAIERIIKDNPGRKIAVCSHRVVLKTLIMALQNMDNSRFNDVVVQTGSISEFEYSGGIFKIIGINRTEHLATIGAQRLTSDF